jgi:hypothetical protein
MERSLILLAFALGGVVWLCGFLSSGVGRGVDRAAPAYLSKFWIGTAAALPFLVFLATLPAQPPIFSAGHGLGAGFLVGGLLGLLGTWTTLRALGSADRGEPVSAAASIAAPIGLALCAAAVPSLWMRDGVIDALCGTAIGWLCAVFIALSGIASRRQTATNNSAAVICLSLTTGAAVLFCSLAGLGELRGLVDLVGKATAVVHWSAAGLVFASCISVVLLIALLPATLTLRIPLVPLLTGWIERGRDSDEARASARRAWRIGLCSVVILIAGRLIATRFAEDGDEPWKTKSFLLKPLAGLLGPNPMFHVVALGVVAALLVNWLVRDHNRETQAARPPGPIRETNVLALLTLVAAAMMAFQIMGGFGLSMLLGVLILTVGLGAAAGIAGLHEQTPPEANAVSGALMPGLSAASQSVRLVLLGCVLALYRLFSARYESELRGVSLTDHYALFGILFGAVLPPFLTAYLSRFSAGSSDGDSARLFRLATCGVLVLVLPTLIIALWGAKCALALLIGLALSTVFEGSLVSALLALAVALALTQWTHHVLPLSQLTRDQKVNILFWTTAVSVIALLIAEYAGRARPASGNGSVAASSQGGAQ